MVRAGMSSTRSSWAVSPKPTTATKSRGNFERINWVRASTIFLAGTRFERMARLEGLGALLAVPAARHARLAVRPERRRVAQLGEQVAQGALGDLTHALGTEREAVTLALDEAALA